MKEKGFTLIELIIAVAIIGIIASVAVPTYRGYVTMSRRGAAQAALVTLQNKMEANYAVNDNTYVGLADGDGVPLTSVYRIPAEVAEAYTITITDATASSYTLNATPTAMMSGDECGTFTLTDTNVRGADKVGCW